MKKRIVQLIILGLAIGGLLGTITARASISDDIGVCWWKMNRAHEAADIARSLGYENGSAEQQAVLKEFGKTWTEANNQRKELEAQQKDHQGVWTITAYCNDGRSASDMANIAGQTCACNCLPAGTVIEIEGMGRWTVTDRGASTGQWAWHNSNWCDIYLGSEAECQQWGVQHRDVYLVK